MSLDDYEPVASRVQRFYAAHPNGAIHTELVFDDGVRVIIKATVWRDITDPMPSAVDYSEEILTDRGVNSTSRVENASTSATGRAISIAAAGLGSSDWTKKPSREEMAKVQRATTGNPGYETTTVKGPVMAGQASEKQIGYIKGACKRAGVVPPTWLDSLTKQDASAFIEAEKNGEPVASIIARMASEEPF